MVLRNKHHTSVKHLSPALSTPLTFKGNIMKKSILLALAAALTLAACADTRSHISQNSSQWETVPYQVGAAKEPAQ